MNRMQFVSTKPILDCICLQQAWKALAKMSDSNNAAQRSEAYKLMFEGSLRTKSPQVILKTLQVRCLNFISLNDAPFGLRVGLC